MNNSIPKTVNVWSATGLIACLALVGTSGSWAQQSSSAAPSIKGVWRVVEITRTGPNASTNSNPQPGLWIIADKHYTYLTVNADKARPEMPATKMTDKDRADAYNGLTAQGGTYERTADELTMKVFVARNPEAMRAGSVFKNTYKLEGKTLSITQTANQNGPVANPTTTKLVRLE